MRAVRARQLRTEARPHPGRKYGGAKDATTSTLGVWSRRSGRFQPKKRWAH